MVEFSPLVVCSLLSKTRVRLQTTKFRILRLHSGRFFSGFFVVCNLDIMFVFYKIASLALPSSKVLLVYVFGRQTISKDIQP